MRQHTKAYEQYCWVKQKNIVLEETVFHNGTKSVKCTYLDECRRCGGCRNSALNEMWNKKVSLFSDVGNNAAIDN